MTNRCLRLLSPIALVDARRHRQHDARVAIADGVDDRNAPDAHIDGRRGRDRHSAACFRRRNGDGVKGLDDYSRWRTFP
jgi:hypothetical protein